MKKFTLIIAIALMIGLTSCNKEYVCTLSEDGFTTTATLTDDNVEACFQQDDEDETCVTLSYEELGDEDITDKKSAKASLEDEGYTCK